jgi:DNA-binding transcriptional MerR regulator
MIDGKSTTSEAAARVGISLVTLQRWIAAEKVQPPKPTLVGAVGYRLWSDKDIEELKIAKRAFYRKGGGRKKKKH